MPAPTTTKRDEAGIMRIASRATAFRKRTGGGYHAPHRPTSRPPRRRRRAGAGRARRARRRRRARHERDRPAHRDQREHRLPAARDARRGAGYVEHVPATGPLPALAPARPARERRARPPRSPCARAAAPGGARARDGRDGDALRAGRARRRHGRLRARLRPPCRASPSSGGRASGTRLRSGKVLLAFGRRRRCRRRRWPRSRRGRSPTRSGSRRSSSGSAGVGYAEARDEREEGLSAIAAPVRGQPRRARRHRRPAGTVVALRRAGGRGPPAASLARPRVRRLSRSRA